jgi:hypothetical protein
VKLISRLSFFVDLWFTYEKKYDIINTEINVKTIKKIIQYCIIYYKEYIAMTIKDLDLNVKESI